MATYLFSACLSYGLAILWKKNEKLSINQEENYIGISLGLLERAMDFTVNMYPNQKEEAGAVRILFLLDLHQVPYHIL